MLFCRESAEVRAEAAGMPVSVRLSSGRARAFFKPGKKAGIQPHHASKLARQLTRLDESTSPEGMNVPGWRLHALSHDLAGYYAVTVNGNWRMTFRFENGNAVLLDYQDYH